MGAPIFDGIVKFSPYPIVEMGSLICHMRIDKIFK